HYWWGWVFLLNVPIALAGLLATIFLLPESRAAERPGLDFGGILLSIAGLALVTYGLVSAGENGWTSPTTLGGIAGGLLLLAAFGWLESQRASAPAPGSSRPGWRASGWAWEWRSRPPPQARWPSCLRGAAVWGPRSCRPCRSWADLSGRPSWAASWPRYTARTWRARRRPACSPGWPWRRGPIRQNCWPRCARLSWTAWTWRCWCRRRSRWS